MVINIIHLANDQRYPHREEREKSIIRQMQMEKCEYKFWPGVIENPRKSGINKAHKQIIQWAKQTDQPSVTIAEDDLLWYGSGAWKYYLDNVPKEYDIYLGSYYSGSAGVDNIIKSFSGLTLYTVNSVYFDKYLSIPDNIHIDKGISLMGGRFVVCPKFVCKQMVGYSEQRGRKVDDSARHKNKLIFGQ